MLVSRSILFHDHPRAVSLEHNPLGALTTFLLPYFPFFLISWFSHCLIFSFSQISFPFRTTHKAQLHALCFHTESLHPFAYFAHLCHSLRARLFSSRTIFVYTDLSCTPRTLSPTGKHTHPQGWYWRNNGTSSISPAPCFRSSLWHDKLTMPDGHTAPSLASSRTGQCLMYALGLNSRSFVSFSVRRLSRSLGPSKVPDLDCIRTLQHSTQIIQ